MQNLRTRSVMLLAGLLTPVLAGATDFDTTSPAMMRGDTPATGNGWSSDPLFTAGETIDGYQPVGVLDGLGALVLVGGQLVGGGFAAVRPLDDRLRQQ